MNDYTQTPNLGLYKPEVNADYDLWGDHLNANSDILDGILQAKAVVSDTAPANPRPGDLWFDTVNAQLYVWYVDPTSAQWVIATAQNSAALVSDIPPSNPTKGQFWFDGVGVQLYVWYVDPTGPGQWVPAVTAAQGPPGPQGPPAVGVVWTVADWLTAGQPDGTTDNTAQIQAAITAAAGKAALVIPANVNNYIIGKLTIPSNTHLIIAQGATLFQKAAAGGTMLGLVVNVNNVLIDLYGTINGNAAAQTTGGCGGIGGGPCSDVYVRGNRQGLITNTKHWSVNINSCTNGEVSGLTMTNGGASVEFTGLSTQKTTVASGTYTSATGVTNLVTTAAHGIAVGAEFMLLALAGTGTLTAINGSYIATAGTAGTTLNCIATTGAGVVTITGGQIWTTAKSSNVGFTNCVVSNINDLGLCLYGGVVNGFIRGCEVSGCMSSGPSMLSDTGQPGVNVGCEISGCLAHDNTNAPGIVVSANVVGGSPKKVRVFNNICYNNKGGILLTAADGIDCYGNVLYNNLLGTPLGNGASGELAISSAVLRANVWGNNIRDPQIGATTGYGIALYLPNNCRVAGNYFYDGQATQTMQACIGGSWGLHGLSEGNYYGPRIGVTADVSTYSNQSVQAFSFDMTQPTIVGVGSLVFGGLLTQAAIATAGATYPNRGLTVGWNASGGAGEIDFLCGQASGNPGGFNFYQVSNAGTVNTGVGVSGSLLATDGYGNTRVGGALCHGGYQNGTIANGGTLTILPNVDFVAVQNAASIAAGTIVLPTPPANALASHYELEILYISQIGTLTISPPGGYIVQNAPTSMPTASGCHKFVLDGTTWRRRIML